MENCIFTRACEIPFPSQHTHRYILFAKFYILLFQMTYFKSLGRRIGTGKECERKVWAVPNFPEHNGFSFGFLRHFDCCELLLLNVKDGTEVIIWKNRRGEGSRAESIVS